MISYYAVGLHVGRAFGILQSEWIFNGSVSGDIDISIPGYYMMLSLGYTLPWL